MPAAASVESGIVGVGRRTAALGAVLALALAGSCSTPAIVWPADERAAMAAESHRDAEKRAPVIDVAVESGAKLRGTVHFTDGRPAAGATVAARWGDDAKSASAAFHVGADGSFEISALPSHAVDVRAWKSLGKGDATRLVARRRDVVPGGAPLEIVLGEGLTIEGRVARRDGAAVPGVRVVALPGDEPRASVTSMVPQATTDADGVFRLEGLDAGVYRVTCRGRDSLGQGGEIRTTGGERVEAGEIGVVLTQTAK